MARENPTGERRRAYGFTLPELAIALVIIGLLLASALIPITTQMELKSISDTQRTLEQVRDALIGFAQANGRLPCPADGSLAVGNANAGRESSSCDTGPTSRGVVPWATLGVPETDAWGRRISYRVSPVFADNPSSTTTYATTAGTDGTLSWQDQSACTSTPLTAAQVSYSLCTQGNISIYTRSDANHSASPLALQVAAVVISHGKNGYGAWGTNGVQVSGVTSGTDEAINAAHGTTTVSTTPQTLVYVSRQPSQQASGCSDSTAGVPFCEFDDIVTWIPTSLLIARTVAAGKLP